MAALICVSSAAEAGIIIIVADGKGEGFNDGDSRDPVGGNLGTTLGEQRLIAFEYAATLMEGVVSSPVDIIVRAKFDRLFCNADGAVLGSAGAASYLRDFADAPIPQTWFPIALANKIAAQDLDPTAEDIEAEFNAAIGTTCTFPNVWYYGLDGNPGDGEIDLVTVVLHELGHGLGFATIVELFSGQKGLGTGFDDAFMLHLEDHDTGELYPDMTDEERVAASTSAPDLHWVGPAVVAAGGFLTDGRDEDSGHVQMYAPEFEEPGSSVSHFDADLAPSELMEPGYQGPNHDVGLMAPLFDDIGWNGLGITTTTTPGTTLTTTTTLSETTTTVPPTSTSVEPGTTTTLGPTSTTVEPSTTTTAGPTSTTTGETTTTTLGDLRACADPSGDASVTASDALLVLRAAIGGTSCEPCLCDVNGSGGLTASDALAVLRAAVGIATDLECPACAPSSI